jgi:thiosulfate/3-mercaptopyruvate sulfurtransferase
MNSILFDRFGGTMTQIIGKFILKSYGIIAFAFCLAMAFSDQLRSHPSVEKKWNLTESWIVSPAQAVELKEKGAFLLDARATTDRVFESLPGARTVSWEEFSVAENPLKGRLLSSEKLEKKISQLGVKKNGIILVFGDPLSGWGEEGRIVWTLRSADYPHSYWVDGGVHKFLDQLKGTNTKGKNTAVIEVKGKYTRASLDIESETLKKEISNAKQPIALLDVREEREYLGETPYGESRGGHIPGAKWLYYRNFLDSEGFVRPKTEIIKLLQSKNITPNTNVISYCTGGIRSAWTTSLFLSYGLKAQNYSGSMWEWASKDAKSFPLQKGRE